MPKVVILIPSRYSASRLPGKPLLKVKGIPLIAHVYKKAKETNIEQVYVVTGDIKILKALKKFTNNCILTKNKHRTGTDRIHEGAKKLRLNNNDYVVNLQGDEPLISVKDINRLIKVIIRKKLKIGTLACQINDNKVKQKFNDNNIVKVKTYKKDTLANDFIVEFGKQVKVSGKRFDAKNLGKYFGKKSDNNFLKKINRNIDIDIKNIDTPLSKKLKNFRLIGVMEKGKFVKISSKGDFGDNKFLDISLKNDKKNEKKYLEVYSDLPQPLLSEFSFFKGLSGGILSFTSIIDKDVTDSKLIIKDFRIINAPGVVQLLSLADFGGLADLAQGEGLSFEKLEIKTSSKKDFLLV